MTTKNSAPSTPNTQLKEQVTRQSDQLSQLHSRVNDLVDELFVIRQELNTFKKNVAADVKYLVNRDDK